MSQQPDCYLDVAGDAIGGGFRVALISGGRLRAQALVDTARDVAAVAVLCDAPVLTHDTEVRRACRDGGARLVAHAEECTR
ncbi:MAG: hypothetical protein IPO81_19225 [Kouleothrix sp.]|nr:hypothetical protein [Kouleothrix sp.]